MPLGILAIFILISGPSMLIAALKLRQRNLGPILDANGWAVNAKAKVNIPFGGSLTQIPRLPPGSHRDLVDPYAESHRGRDCAIGIVVVLLALLGCWYFGAVEKVLPGVLPKSGWILQREKKAKEAEAAAATRAATQKAQAMPGGMSYDELFSTSAPAAAQKAQAVTKPATSTATAP